MKYYNTTNELIGKAYNCCLLAMNTFYVDFPNKYITPKIGVHNNEPFLEWIYNNKSLKIIFRDRRLVVIHAKNIDTDLNRKKVNVYGKEVFRLLDLYFKKGANNDKFFKNRNTKYTFIDTNTSKSST